MALTLVWTHTCSVKVLSNIFNTMSGKMETWNMSDGCENHANEIALISQYQFDNGWLWKFNAKYMNAPRANYADYGGSSHLLKVRRGIDGYQLF